MSSKTRIVKLQRRQDGPDKWSLWNVVDGQLYWTSLAKTERGSRAMLTRYARQQGLIVEGDQAVKYV